MFEALLGYLVWPVIIWGAWFLWRKEQQTASEQAHALAAFLRERGYACGVRGKSVEWDEGGQYRMSVSAAKMEDTSDYMISVACTVPALGLPPMKLVRRSRSPTVNLFTETVNLFTGMSRYIGDVEFDHGWKLTSSVPSTAVRLLRRTDRERLVERMTEQKAAFVVQNRSLTYSFRVRQKEPDGSVYALQAIEIARDCVSRLTQARSRTEPWGR